MASTTDKFNQIVLTMVDVLERARKGDKEALDTLRKFLSQATIRRASSLMLAAQIGLIEINSIVLTDDDSVCDAVAEHIRLIATMGPRHVVEGLAKRNMKVEMTYASDNVVRAVVRAKKASDG